MIKKILIAVVVLGLLAAFVVYRKFRAATGAPLPMPQVLTSAEVNRSLDERLHAAQPAGGGAPAAATGGTVTLGGDELTVLLSRLMPPVEGMRLHLAITDGLADLKLSVPGPELARLAGPQADAMKNVDWLNVDAKIGIRCADGKLSVSVKSIKQPDWLGVDKLQGFLDGLVSRVPPGSLKVKDGNATLTVIGLELKGDDAVIQVARS